MTATVIQQMTTEDVKQAILLLFKENSAELKAFLDDLSSKIVDTPTPKNKKTETEKPEESTFTVVVESPRIPYSEMPFWKANPHLQAEALAFREKNIRYGKGDVASAFKKAQEAFSDLDVTDEEWLLQIQD
jgi:hypothetical protein